MCKCNPGVKTPFCGRGDCCWKQDSQHACDEDQIARMMAVEALADDLMREGAKRLDGGH